MSHSRYESLLNQSSCSLFSRKRKPISAGRRPHSKPLMQTQHLTTSPFRRQYTPSSPPQYLIRRPSSPAAHPTDNRAVFYRGSSHTQSCSFPLVHPIRSRESVAHIRQSRPDSSLEFQVEVLETFFSCSLLARKWPHTIAQCSTRRSSHTKSRSFQRGAHPTRNRVVSRWLMPSHTKWRSFPPGARKYIGGLAEDSAPESEEEGEEAAEVKYT